MNYYQTRSNAYKFVKKMLNLAKEKNRELNKDAVIFETINRFSVSELQIKKWLEMFNRIGRIELSDDTIVVKELIE